MIFDIFIVRFNLKFVFVLKIHFFRKKIKKISNFDFERIFIIFNNLTLINNINIFLILSQIINFTSYSHKK